MSAALAVGSAFSGIVTFISGALYEETPTRVGKNLAGSIGLGALLASVALAYASGRLA